MKFDFAARPEADRTAALRAAEMQGFALLDAIGAELLRPGIGEKALEAEIRDLAAERFGATKHWHKRIVRSGPNTLCVYDENPPDRVIAADDVVFIDIGPVFDGWEADIGRSFVLGDDPAKHRLLGDMAEAFEDGRRHFRENPGLTGREFYRYVQGLAERRDWTFGGTIAGHIVGEFPHKHLPGDAKSFYISPENTACLDAPDALGQRQHWILEIHFVDRRRSFGGFMESLITLD
ncbi:M24 family metallopeptidase [Zavarzinia compransoris]|uniref:Aminopeptidase n=1 Tax=Zavarzinia compransoris TaxID=1264899 RepID=A0A317E177_9PROT|nr:M24 family metallopeptidase [Zavarzinia compransoris]PWR20709.1 aminopeptidase [Zavarzinia compransoris]TDP44464.1 metallopeptidase family M24 [Zavarzinia compransoris]